MKILSPAGNLECLKTAIINGADEVYLGVNEFNARNNIDGFTLDTLKEGVEYAHLFGVKVSLAINILFSNEELESAVNLAVNAYNLGVDSFIIQDLALAYILNKNYPKMQLHASTQMGIHNLEGVKFIEKFGFSRVVLARETPLSEIKRIKENSSIEIEYFAHGALCVSFSGNCYLSSYCFNASGNRGRCKQLCRLPYTLFNGDKKIKTGYLLSAKDFNMINRLKDLKDAGVDVLKIEGRARRPFYVGAITKEYKNALLGLTVNEENISLAFNRGFIDGYFSGNGKVISDYQNHIGIEIGKIEKVNYGKKFNQIYFSSKREISPRSTFKVTDGLIEKTVVTAFDIQKHGEKYIFTTTQKLEKGHSLRLILDEETEKKLLSEKRKLNLKVKLFISAEKEIRAQTEIYGKVISVLGERLEKAKNSPLTKNDVMENFSKSEYFTCDLEFVEFDNVFIPKQKLNAFRREFFDKVYDDIVKVDREKLLPIENLDFSFSVEPFKDFQVVEKVDEEFNSKNVIYSPEVYDIDKIKEFIKKCKTANKIAYLDTPNFATKEDIELLKNVVKKTNVEIVANNYYALTLGAKYIVGAGLNVYNGITAKVLNSKMLFAETSVGKRMDFPYMTLRHCPIKNHVGGDCKNCKYKSGYYYKTESGKVLSLKRKKLSTCTFYLV